MVLDVKLLRMLTLECIGLFFFFKVDWNVKKDKIWVYLYQSKMPSKTLEQAYNNMNIWKHGLE